MCFKKKRVHFTKGNENKRLYPVLPFPEDTEKKPFNNLDVVNFTDLCTVVSLKTKGKHTKYLHISHLRTQRVLVFTFKGGIYFQILINFRTWLRYKS